jgi:hypothetical protein
VITVYIWNFRGKSVAWGHASMQVSQTYISWWPQGEGRVYKYPSAHASNGDLVRGTLGNIYAASPFRDRQFEADCLAEGRFVKRVLPDHRIYLQGLDENAILDWWQSFGLTRNGVLYAGPLPAWHTTQMNCSTVVARGLEIGGGDKYASWWQSWNVVWKPNDVLRYALSIEEGLARAAK